MKSLVTRVSRKRDSGGPWRYTVRGFAWNDGTPISTVEVAVDDGPFRSTELSPPGSPYGWTPFRWEWRPVTSGKHRIVSRATDARGTQPSAAEASRYKATPWENHGQVVREIEIPRDG